MTKSHKKSVTNPAQLSLLDLLKQEQVERAATRPGRLNITAQIQAAIKNAISNAPKSREIIADEMTALLGIEITTDKLYNWTAGSHPHRMPGEYYSAFCVATGDIELIRIQAEAAGVYTLPGPDALRAEIQKQDELIKDLQAQKRKSQVFLAELEGKR
ncbi:hypothetical protein KI809_15515 [Geobacter pelophilus]|uniref:Uncharacterized protein n=1 Tax=Geoanaerobacter pelophilus TaxID=60036 RepID=A0AAW4L6B3_9BACT|nr:hypothetical protein [Geoanaerobacter pelophilus]MBT0665717.1 hypothetical protein [Geoanaerobacter pelophilus]